MDEYIRKQDAIKAFDCTDELIVVGSANAQNVMNYINKVVGKIKALPSVQSKNEERMSETEQNVPNDDLISRKGAIDAIEAVFPVDPMKSEYAQGIACGAALSKTYIEQLPSAQSEIIRCKECRHYEWMSNRIPEEQTWHCHCWDADTGKDDFCSYAERRTDD